MPIANAQTGFVPIPCQNGKLRIGGVYIYEKEGGRSDRRTGSREGRRYIAACVAALLMTLPKVRRPKVNVCAEGGQMVRLCQQKRLLFLAELRKTLGVAPAADAVGISRTTAYRWRESDPKFAQAWDDAIAGALDDIEKSLAERAKSKDTIAGIFLLKSQRRSIYADSPPSTQLNVNVNSVLLANHLGKLTGGATSISQLPEATVPPPSLEQHALEDIRPEVYASHMPEPPSDDELQAQRDQARVTGA